MKQHKYSRKAPSGSVKKPTRPMSAKAGSNTAKLNKFAKSLNEEARKKQKLRAQMDEIRSNMSTY